MAPLEATSSTGLPSGLVADRDFFPLANTESTDSADSFETQISPELRSESPVRRPLQLPYQASTLFEPSVVHNLLINAQVPIISGQQNIVHYPDGSCAIFMPPPQTAQGDQVLHHYSREYSGYSQPNQDDSLQYTHTSKPLSMHDMNQSQEMDQYQRTVHDQTHPGRDLRESVRSSVHQHGSHGFDRGSVPLVHDYASASAAPGDTDGHQTYRNWRQNAQRVPHPYDNPIWGGNNRARRDFHSWNHNRGQQVQNYTQNYVPRHASASNNFHGESRSPFAVSFNGGDHQQNSQQVVDSHRSLTSPFNPEPSARNDQPQISTMPLSGVDTNSRCAFEDNLAQATSALKLEQAGTPKGHGMDDITPRRPINNNTVSATAPPKLGHQTPMLRSRKGQSVAQLTGSPLRQPSQPLSVHPAGGPSLAFYPPNTQSVGTISGGTFSVPAVSEVQFQFQTPASRSRTASVRSEEPFTARAITFSPDQQVTLNSTQAGRDQIQMLPYQTAPNQSAPYQTAPNQIVPYQMASTQIAPYQMASTQIIPYQIAPVMMPTLSTGPPSRHLSLIAPEGKKPSIEVACDPQNLPFVELLRRAQPSNSNGVVHISNIPYGTTQSEIVAFLGRNAMILEDKKEPIHVIMDRVTGKTMDAYVEFTNMKEAVKAVDRQIEIHRDGNKGGRLGNRFVTVEVSGLEQMMHALFPKAKNVIWHGMVPEIIPADPADIYNTGFKGFVNSEELVLLVKQVQDPNRVHFSENCPQRPFECMISTVIKYPWFMVDYITIGDRDQLFKAAFDIVKAMLPRISEDDLLINPRLLKRITNVIFTCPGFCESQKDDIAFICNINPYSLRPPLTPFADHWYVFRTIGPKPHVVPDVLEYYIALIREATTSMDVVSLAERGNPNILPPYFGNINMQYPADVKTMTFAQVAPMEWQVIETLLRRSLEG